MDSFLEFWGAPILSLMVSVIYFRVSPSTQPLSTRLLASAHGVTIAVFYFVALGVWASGASRASYYTPFIVLSAIPLSFIGLSLFCFRGSRFVHLLQGVNLVCLLWTCFVGSMAVTGDWL